MKTMKTMKKPVAILITVLILVTSMMSCLTASAALVGDVNHDGNVTASDARIVLRAVAKLEWMNEEDYYIADANHDRNVTASDARIILRVAAKLEAPESISEDASYDWSEETTTGASVEPTTTAPTTKPIVTTTVAPTTKPIVTTTTAPTTRPVTPTSDYDRLVQYLKRNGSYSDGEYVVKRAYTYKDMKVITTINYDVQKSRVEFYSHGFYGDGSGSSIGLYYDKDSSLQGVVILYETARGSQYFGSGYIYKQSYSDSNNRIYWTRMDCPSSITKNLQELGVSQLVVLFDDVSTILKATGTGITLNSLGFKAY